MQKSEVKQHSLTPSKKRGSPQLQAPVDVVCEKSDANRGAQRPGQGAICTDASNGEYT